MKLDRKKGKGASIALACTFIAGAGFGAFKLARRGASSAAPVATVAAAKTTTAELAAPKAAAPATAPAPAPGSAASGRAAPGAKASDPAAHDEARGATAPQAAAQASEKPSTVPAGLVKDTPGPSIGEAEATFAKDERQGILALRAIAKARTPGPDAPAARARLDQIAGSALEEAAKAKARADAPGERIALTRAFFATFERDARKPIRARLDELVQQLVFGPRATEDGEIYVVKPHDKLWRIASSHKTTWSFIKRVNGLKTDAIRTGQKLKIPKGQFELTVFKSDFLLVGTLDGRYLKAWDVGTGKQDRTPETTFHIAERIPNPSWYSPDGKVYPFGSKENILGTRWMGFERTPELAGFGIHGTAFPETIGTESSMGCIRMRNEDVEEVFDFTPKGCSVQIVR